MAVDNSQSEDIDLERTDLLPIVDGSQFDDDVGDDAVRMDYSAPRPGIKNGVPRPSVVDLPALADSVRSVEERIARQNAEYESLSRSYDEACEARAAATSQAQALTAELAGLRSSLESVETRSRDADKALAARDATIVQVLHTLGERDAQLAALQRDHAQMVPLLEERTRAGTRLEEDLRAARSRADALAVDLNNSVASVAALAARLAAGERELKVTQGELVVIKREAAAHLERLRTREWRRGFDQKPYRELDAHIGTAQDARGVLKSERDQLRQQVNDLESKLAEHYESLAKLKSAAAHDELLLVARERELRQSEQVRADLADQLAAVETERNALRDALATRDESLAQVAAAPVVGPPRQPDSDDPEGPDAARAAMTRQIAALEDEKVHLNGVLAAKDKALEAALAAGASAERIGASPAGTEPERVELLNQFQTMQLESRAREDQMNLLAAQLQEARRPIEGIEAEVKRVSEELHSKTAILEALTEDNRILRVTVERTRAALEERELLIRRLERGERTNANGLGRIQTNERLGSTAGTPPGSGPTPVECSAELARVDGQHNIAYPLARRTRIGRAPGCELQINSSSVSRHHALVLMAQRDVTIEDLNSTNGVLVNGRKVSRQLLNDGDMVTVGEAQFRFSLVLAPDALQAPATT